MGQPSRPMPQGEQSRSIPYRIIRAMFVVVFFWVFWKFGGYIITALIVRRFGSGHVSDAYFFATQAVIYGLVFAPAMAVLVPAFMPIFIEERNRAGEQAAAAFARTMMSVVLLACAVLLVVGYAAAGPITETLVKGFDPQARYLGVELLRWLLPGAAAMVVFLLLRSLLHSFKVFSYPSAAEAAQKLIWVVVFVALVAGLGIRAVVFGFLAGTAVMLLVAGFGLRARLHLLLPAVSAMRRGTFAREAGVAALFLAGTGAAVCALAAFMPDGLARYRELILMTVVLAAVLVYTLLLWARGRGRPGPIARFAVLAAPLIIGTFFASYRNVVTFYFQSFTASGVFSDIEGAKKIVNFPTELVALALGVAMLPYLCELASRRDHAYLGEIVTKALRLLAVSFVPLTVVTIVLADPICRLVLDRGDRSDLHLQYTAETLRYFSVALVFFAAERVLMQAYFSLQRMWTPSLLGIAATVFQVAFLAVPVYALGMDQPEQIFLFVVLAFPLSRILKNLALWLILRRYVPVLPARQTAVFGLKLAVTCAAIALVSYTALGWVSPRLPYAAYRLRKVVLYDAEAQEQVPGAAAPLGRGASSGSVARPAAGAEFNGLTRFRCWVTAADAGQHTVVLTFATKEGEGRVERTMPGGERRQIEVTPAEAGLRAPDWRGFLSVRWGTVDGSPLTVHDVSLRRPPNTKAYMAVLFVHCAAPSLAALVVMLVCLKVLRFRELDEVVRWVKNRGWRRQRSELEAQADGTGGEAQT